MRYVLVLCVLILCSCQEVLTPVSGPDTDGPSASVPTTPAPSSSYGSRPTSLAQVIGLYELTAFSGQSNYSSFDGHLNVLGNLATGRFDGRTVTSTNEVELWNWFATATEGHVTFEGMPVYINGTYDLTVVAGTMVWHFTKVSTSNG